MLRRFFITGKKGLSQLLFMSALLFLYLSSLSLLFFQLGTYPNGLYNWEQYTVWKIYQKQAAEIPASPNQYLIPTEGLMTDSGLSPLVGLPIEMISQPYGMHLWSLRAWSAFIGIFTIIFFFFFVRQLFGAAVAFLSSAAMLYSSSYLVYMRTATNVGISLLFSLFTVFFLYLVWQHPRKISYYVFLLLSLTINSYLYAPIRFFLLLSVLFLILRLILFWRKKHVKKSDIIIKSILFLSIGLFVGVNLLLAQQYVPSLTPFVTNYFHGRGEQIITIYAENADLQKLGLQSLLPFLATNIKDFISLYLNIHTRPTSTDFWNPHGQIITSFFVPFFLIGLVFALWKSKNFHYFLLLAWFVSTSLPIIFTNNVHVGRLFFSLPPLFIFVGLGLFTVGSLITILLRQTLLFRKMATVACYLLLLACSFGIALWYEMHAYFANIPTIENHLSVDFLNYNGIATTDIYLFNADYESLGMWTNYFYLKDRYVFVDVANPQKVIAGNQTMPYKAYVIDQNASRNDENFYSSIKRKLAQ